MSARDRGRADDAIIRGGENISPSEIEDVLLRYKSVQAAAVVGVPDPEWGETVAAAVVVEHGPGAPDPDQLCEVLRSLIREHLGSLKTPTRVDVWDELPATATGKLLCRAVRDQLAADVAPASDGAPPGTGGPTG